MREKVQLIVYNLSPIIDGRPPQIWNLGIIAAVRAMKLSMWLLRTPNSGPNLRQSEVAKRQAAIDASRKQYESFRIRQRETRKGHVAAVLQRRKSWVAQAPDASPSIRPVAAPPPPEMGPPPPPPHAFRAPSPVPYPGENTNPPPPPASTSSPNPFRQPPPPQPALSRTRYDPSGESAEEDLPPAYRD
jgi:hypothetical protein